MPFVGIRVFLGSDQMAFWSAIVEVHGGGESAVIEEEAEVSLGDFVAVLAEEPAVAAFGKFFRDLDPGFDGEDRGVNLVPVGDVLGLIDDAAAIAYDAGEWTVEISIGRREAGVEGEGTGPDDEVQRAGADEFVTRVVLEYEVGDIEVLRDASGLPHADAFEMAHIGGLGGFAAHHTIGFSAVVEFELEFRGRKMVEPGRAGLERLEKGFFIGNSAELGVSEIVDVEGESEVAGFETQDILETFAFAFPPAVLPEGVGVILVGDAREVSGLSWLIWVLCGEGDGGEERENGQSDRKLNVHGKE